MKILTGCLKGRVISLSPGDNLRPTSDLVRKAIFDTLQGTARGKRALDLFGGTGALGFEALSSGAREVIWVEASRQQAKTIEKTISNLGLGASGRVIQSDALKAIKNLDHQGESFGLIFLDPPYHDGLGARALKLIADSKIFTPDAIIVLETHKTEDPPESTGPLRAIKMKKHGDTKITFYGAS